MTIVQILLNVLIGGSLNKLWDMLNTMQMVVFIPLLSLRTPSFLVSFLSVFNIGSLRIDTDDSKLNQELSFYSIFKAWNDKKKTPVGQM
jgi:hypothetical protein